MDDAMLLKLWGKTGDKSDPNPKTYHPLLYHLIDVGVAAEAIWPLLTPATRRRLAQALGVEEEEARRAIILLIALHDLGKASGFQAKVPGLWETLQANGLTIAGVDDSAHHAFVTAATLPTLLEQTDSCGVRVPHITLANTLANAVGAHHGTFPDGTDYSGAVLGGTSWTVIREALARRLVRALFPGLPTVILPGRELEDPAAGVLLTGLTAVADWIGSNQNFFTLSAEPDIDAYAAQARSIVTTALNVLGWTPIPEFTTSLPFSKIIWGRDSVGEAIRFTPQGVQGLTEELLQEAQEPFMLLVEAAMGEGKTEASLYAADRALTTGIAHGIAMGLPTQATGNAMFGRVTDFLHHRGHSVRLNLQLLHGQAEFHEGFQKLRLAANSKKGEEAPVVAESWFTRKKQALLAPFGVGTIDQSLMGVLQTKHWFVRLFGLAGKVVIFDEVHAYDAYMNALLQRLVAWLSALDCSIVLLSATLPATTRRELIEAFSPGAVVPEAAYPRVTYLPRSSTPQCRTAPVNAAPKRVHLRTRPADYTALARQLLAELPEGGCAVVICNTVRNAQAAYEAFRTTLPEEWELELFHARTPLKWRKEREDSVLTKLGKPTREGVKRPNKYVLIGTQVLEQSLDYDADWMASEYAPVDLILQRMGRLWRHSNRPTRPIADPRFTLLVTDLKDAADVPTFPEGSALIYDYYLLLRTYLALQERSEIVLPTDIEPLVKAVYDDPAPEGLPETWDAVLSSSFDLMERDSGDERGQAHSNLIPDWRKRTGRPKIFSAIVETRAHLEDDEDPATPQNQRATTRLGDSSIPLLCLNRLSDDTHEPICGGKLTDTKALLLSAVSISRPKGLFYALLNQPQPDGWEEDPHLRYARHALFTGGKAQIGKYTLLLSNDIGLRIEKEEAE